MKSSGLCLAAVCCCLLLLGAADDRLFGPPVALESVAERTANVTLGDLNNDGKLDIVLAKGRHWPLHSVVLFGDGKGHFASPQPLPAPPSRTYSAPLADLDGDGKLDMVLSNDQPDPKYILLNDGAGHFKLAGTFGDPNWPTRNVALADLNGDGSPDIAVANRPGPSYVCFNNGKARFTCRQLGPESSATILAGDLRSKGVNDLVVACRDSCQSVVYFNDGRGNFPRKVPFGPVRASTRAIALGDFDGDGRLDIAAYHEEQGLFVYFNKGDGTFDSGIQVSSREAMPYSMLTSDLRRSGRADIIVGYVNAPGAIFFNEGTGRKYNQVMFGDSKGAIYGLAAGDLNGDGFPDIVAARSDAPSIVLFSQSAMHSQVPQI